MHFLGIAGLPRRYPDYSAGYAGWNQVISYGSICTLFAVIIFFYSLSSSTFVKKE